MYLAIKNDIVILKSAEVGSLYAALLRPEINDKGQITFRDHNGNIKTDTISYDMNEWEKNEALDDFLWRGRAANLIPPSIIQIAQIINP